jgi:hypothetical protein
MGCKDHKGMELYDTEVKERVALRCKHSTSWNPLESRFTWDKLERAHDTLEQTTW